MTLTPWQRMGRGPLGDTGALSWSTGNITEKRHRSSMSSDYGPFGPKIHGLHHLMLQGEGFEEES